MKKVFPFRFPYTLESSGDFIWCRDTETHIPLLLVGSLPIYNKAAQGAMELQGVQDVSIEAITKRHELGDINYRASIIRFPILQSIHG